MKLSPLQREPGKLGVRMDDFASTYEVLYDTLEIEEAEQRLALNSHYDALSHKITRGRSRKMKGFPHFKLKRMAEAQFIHQEANNRRPRSSVEFSSSLQRRAEMAAKAP